MNPVLFSPDYLAQCYSENYAEAQQRFKRQSASLSEAGLYREFEYPERGPNAESLITAVAWQGDADAERVLVLQSATHGVEGFAGSAIQLDTLRTLSQQGLPEGVAVLYIHALNPYGFAWLRRVNEEGVDLNRNFVDFSRPLPINADYARLANSIVPEQKADWARATRALDEFRVEYGQQAWELAISGGQYQFADGLFYGGSKASRSGLYLQQIIEDFRLQQRSSVAVIDVHSGLGPFGYGEVICDHPPESIGVERARQWYGESVTEPALGSSSSVPKQGLIDYLWQRQLADRVCFVTLEFGSYSIEKMFEVLRQDNFHHANASVWEEDKIPPHKQAIRDVFYPATADWQEMILMRGRQCVGQALQGLGQR